MMVNTKNMLFKSNYWITKKEKMQCSNQKGQDTDFREMRFVYTVYKLMRWQALKPKARKQKAKFSTSH